MQLKWNIFIFYFKPLIIIVNWTTQFPLYTVMIYFPFQTFSYSLELFTIYGDSIYTLFDSKVSHNISAQTNDDKLQQILKMDTLGKIYIEYLLIMLFLK